MRAKARDDIFMGVTVSCAVSSMILCMHWVQKTLRARQASQWLRCAEADAIGLSADAMTAGCPKRDVLSSVITVPRAGETMIGLPVPRLEKTIVF